MPREGIEPSYQVRHLRWSAAASGTCHGPSTLHHRCPAAPQGSQACFGHVLGTIDYRGRMRLCDGVQWPGWPRGDPLNGTRSAERR
ncbi:MAG: hypothetical protein MJA29_00245, partial [Candidatus Omnitrophica bacterium]|nr:hypothetical protein [Candidatus Omnitrophota bacterium]